MASPTLLTPTSKPRSLISSKFASTTIAAAAVTPNTTTAKILKPAGRREFVALIAGIISPALLFPVSPASADTDEEYVKETAEVINKIRTTISMDRNDPNVANAVTDLRETSNSWVAKYRREKSLLGRVSFRDMYSALNAVSGHYVSFGPTAPLPAKRKARILEEMDSVEKSLQRGR
ncbi:photosystem II repair protein PSB27-H1, chloroplastic-like [Papaver somniferum]|uniref:photosystem II repair protein PSB27-H1, chloroplastic-like n=1 Tax=Papaver somniferum TaxID=3469 RepID=UPI000E6F4F16|nr:photosystem II repair protein PSB27-H1, chloroplastic-like [Papaver somniferum]